MKNKLISLIKKESVLITSVILAIISCFIIHPDQKYLEYIDYSTLIILFCLMLTVACFRELGALDFVAGKLLKITSSDRGINYILVFLCFFTSMFITNDVALITFVPLALMILADNPDKVSTCITITLMTIAANLGSMMTPAGNPQSLFLFNKSGISLWHYFQIMFPYWILAGLLLAALIPLCFRKRKKMPVLCTQAKNRHASFLALFVCTVLFVLCILTVLHIINIYILLGITLITILFLNKKMFLKVDYSLLLTFVALFIFIGNMGRLSSFKELLINISSGHEIVTALATSQVISNVPAAILLSGFTDNYTDLLIGTNIGGLGTLIASMASLISFRQISNEQPSLKHQYFLIFTAFNILFLAIYILLIFTTG